MSGIWNRAQGSGVGAPGMPGCCSKLSGPCHRPPLEADSPHFFPWPQPRRWREIHTEDSDSGQPKGVSHGWTVLEGLSCRGRNNGCADLWSGGRSVSGCLLPYPVCACSVASNSLRPHGLQPAKLLCPWDSPGKQTGAGCRLLLQGTFPTQRSKLSLCLVHWRMDSLPLYHCAPREAPVSSSAVVTMHRRENCSSVPG